MKKTEKKSKLIGRLMVKATSVALPLMAVVFAMPMCAGRLYEPEMPEKLREN